MTALMLEADDATVFVAAACEPLKQNALRLHHSLRTIAAGLAHGLLLGAVLEAWGHRSNRCESHPSDIP